MKVKQVLDNRDPYRMGRVLIDDGWIHPICMMTGDSGEFYIPSIGMNVLVYEQYYIGTCVL